MRSVLLQICVLLAGCSYPEIGFVPEDAAPDLAVEDSAEPVDTVTDATDTIEPPADVCVCSERERCVSGGCHAYASCAALHAAAPTLGNGVYTIDPDGAGPVAPFAAYCEMVEDGGGWTLVLKIDGAKKTFAYDAALWTNEETLNPTSSALDTEEAKLASFSTMPFTSLRLGMLDGARRWMRLDVGGPSLHAMFAGAQVVTSAGRAQWMTLLASPRLQTYCGAEGFNRDFTSTTTYAARGRLAIFGNNEANCDSPDSFIGFGVGFVAPHMCIGVDPGIVAGNFNPLSCGGSAGNERATAAFGYVLLR